MSISASRCSAILGQEKLRDPARLLAFILAASLSPITLCAETVAAGTNHAAPSATALLSSAKTAERDFDVTTGFRLTQNTIQLDTRLGSDTATHTFVLDSGAPMTIASPLVQALDLQSLASIGLAGPEGGHRSVPVVQLPDVAIDGLIFRDVGAVVDWVEPPATLACLSTAGLMGASLLQAAIWQIDFNTQKITMTNSLSNLRGLKGAMKIPFVRSDAAGSPRISVGVSDSEDVSLLIDLGFNGSIAIPTKLLEHAGDTITDSDPTEIGQASSTVFGHTASTVRIAQLRELRVGSLLLTDFPVITGTSVSDFHVGIDFLRHFRVTLDWLHNDLYLEPRGPESALYSDFPTYGFAPQLHDGGLVVGALWQGSAGDEAGLELGDRLVEIDGLDTTAPGFESLCGLLNNVSLYGSKASPISVTRLRDGVRETFVVARTPLLTGKTTTAKQ